MTGAQASITRAVTAWAGVIVQAHRFGGVEYLLGEREIGHIHGDHLVDIPFPKKVRDAIVLEKRAQPHHVLPRLGLGQFLSAPPRGCGAGSCLACRKLPDCAKTKTIVLLG